MALLRIRSTVLNVVLNIKEQQSPYRNYNDNDTGKRYRWTHIQKDFTRFMNDKNVDGQLESILLLRALLKRQMT